MDQVRRDMKKYGHWLIFFVRLAIKEVVTVLTLLSMFFHLSCITFNEGKPYSNCMIPNIKAR